MADGISFRLWRQTPWRVLLQLSWFMNFRKKNLDIWFSKSYKEERECDIGEDSWALKQRERERYL